MAVTALDSVANPQYIVSVVSQVDTLSFLIFITTLSRKGSLGRSCPFDDRDLPAKFQLSYPPLLGTSTGL